MKLHSENSRNGRNTFAAVTKPTSRLSDPSGWPGEVALAFPGSRNLRLPWNLETRPGSPRFSQFPLTPSRHFFFFLSFSFSFAGPLEHPRRDALVHEIQAQIGRPRRG